MMADINRQSNPLVDFRLVPKDMCRVTPSEVRRRLQRNPGRYIARGELRPGLTLLGTYRGTSYTLSVRSFKDTLVFDLAGLRFTSLSSAAKHIMGQEVNGWRFWRIPDA
jgi:hypothetical protein